MLHFQRTIIRQKGGPSILRSPLTVCMMDSSFDHYWKTMNDVMTRWRSPMMGYRRIDLNVLCRSEISRCDSTNLSSGITAKVVVIYILGMTVNVNKWFEYFLHLLIWGCSRENVLCGSNWWSHHRVLLLRRPQLSHSISQQLTSLLPRPCWQKPNLCDCWLWRACYGRPACLWERRTSSRRASSYRLRPITVSA